MNPDLDYLFHPRSIAVVGASGDPEKQGYRYVQLLSDNRFPGTVYPINPHGQNVLGLTGYASLKETPGPVDYVISCIPASGIIQLVGHCADKGVRAIQCFTGRFSETGRVENANLEQELRRRAREAGIRILGPNCMGIYCPANGLAFKPMPQESGPVAVISQSGGHLAELVDTAGLRGVRFSKAVSYGNAIDIDETELMHYLGQDPETLVIGAYLEGTRDGKRFMEVLEDVSSRKPVVLLKGGRTRAGTRAVRSHTGSLAGAWQVWEAVARQTGTVLVSSLEEMADMLVAFRYCKPTTGNRVGVVGGGGGRSVESADECERAGLSLEPIPESLREEFKKKAPDLWDWVSNPVDGSILLGSALTDSVVLEALEAYPDFDMLIVNLDFWLLDEPRGVPQVKSKLDSFLTIARATHKPIALVIGDTLSNQLWRNEALTDFREAVIQAGVAQYPTVGRAARALRRLAAFYAGHETNKATVLP